MQYEVELKFPLRDADAILNLLGSLKAIRKAEQVQVDQYFAHPSRDFAATDEALRIRSVGDENRLTYKGPVIDKATKTRHESELSFESGAGSAEKLAQIWESLGFRRVRVVRKQRETYQMVYHGRNLEVCLDQVEGLGSFLEIETLSDASEMPGAQQAILSFAAELNLSAPEPRSYLEMLIELDDCASNRVS